MRFNLAFKGLIPFLVTRVNIVSCRYFHFIIPSLPAYLKCLASGMNSGTASYNHHLYSYLLFCNNLVFSLQISL
jgi:hypothetical protein